MRKGQAALEFLTTYGWAFLVILVILILVILFWEEMKPRIISPSIPEEKITEWKNTPPIIGDIIISPTQPIAPNLTVTAHSLCPSGTVYESVRCGCHDWKNPCMLECFECVEVE